MTIREFVAIIRHNLNSLSFDNYISSEYIYNVGLSISKLLTKRESDSRKLFKNTAGFTFIKCVEMEEVSVAECTGVSIPGCKKMMRSKKVIPEVFSSSYGSVMFVFNVDRSKDYIEVNPISYKSILNQKYKSKSKGYFWVENKYLIIPDSEVEVVTLFGLFSNVDEVDTTGGCKKLLDKDFPILEHLLSSMIDLTTRTVISSKQIPVDENANIDTKS